MNDKTILLKVIQRLRLAYGHCERCGQRGGNLELPEKLNTDVVVDIVGQVLEQEAIECKLK